MSKCAIIGALVERDFLQSEAEIATVILGKSMFRTMQSSYNILTSYSPMIGTSLYPAAFRLQMEEPEKYAPVLKALYRAQRHLANGGKRDEKYEEAIDFKLEDHVELLQQVQQMEVEL